MKAECKNCHVSINIPDEKIIPGQEFVFVCPKCKTQNSIMGSDKNPAAGPAAAEEDAVGEFYEEGAKLALLCFDEGPMRDSLAKIMADLDHIPVIPDSAENALSRIKVTQFKTVLLDENYGTDGSGVNPVLRTLQPMNMASRRRIFLALFGRNFQSLDNMAAFKLSVNAVISLDDAASFDKIIHRAMAEYERFYKVFFEVAQAQSRM